MSPSLLYDKNPMLILVPCLWLILIRTLTTSSRIWSRQCQISDWWKADLNMLACTLPRTTSSRCVGLTLLLLLEIHPWLHEHQQCILTAGLSVLTSVNAAFSSHLYKRSRHCCCVCIGWSDTAILKHILHTLLFAGAFTGLVDQLLDDPSCRWEDQQ